MTYVASGPADPAAFSPVDNRTWLVKCPLEQVKEEKIKLKSLSDVKLHRKKKKERKNPQNHFPSNSRYRSETYSKQSSEKRNHTFSRRAS